MITQTVSYYAAFLAGVLSFFSPCVLPLIPAYFSFITGFSLDELMSGENTQIRKKVILSTLAYVLGFSAVFILMGASASLLGSLMKQYGNAIRLTGGHVIILFGAHLTGIIEIKGLYFEKRIHPQHKPLHFLGTFLVGMAFGAGWSPCIGPMLGSILILAGNQQTVSQGIILLSLYSLGMAIPFIIISFFINVFLKSIRKASSALKYFNMIAGMLLILIGLLLVTNKLAVLSNSLVF